MKCFILDSNFTQVCPYVPNWKWVFFFQVIDWRQTRRQAFTRILHKSIGHVFFRWAEVCAVLTLAKLHILDAFRYHVTIQMGLRMQFNPFQTIFAIAFTFDGMNDEWTRNNLCQTDWLATKRTKKAKRNKKSKKTQKIQTNKQTKTPLNY